MMSAVTDEITASDRQSVKIKYSFFTGGLLCVSALAAFCFTILITF
jgi:hypothetical protein